MNKQQQEAYNKFLKALELQEQGIPRQEIYHMVGYASLDSLTKAFKKQGYKYSEDEQKYIHVSNTECNTERITSSITSLAKPKLQELSVHSEHLELFNDLIEERETLKNMLIWYKKHIDTAGTDILLIELPESENQLVTVRTNKAVWEEFGKFAEENKAFSKGDLVAQALLDFVKRNKA